MPDVRPEYLPQSRRGCHQPITYWRPTADSSVAIIAWRETSQVCSPTTPSAVTPPHCWNASTEAFVCDPKVPSIPCGVVFHWLGAPSVNTRWRYERRRRLPPCRRVGMGPPSGRASQVCGPTIPSTVRPCPCWKVLTAALSSAQRSRPQRHPSRPFDARLVHPPYWIACGSWTDCWLTWVWHRRLLNFMLSAHHLPGFALNQGGTDKIIAMNIHPSAVDLFRHASYNIALIFHLAALIYQGPWLNILAAPLTDVEHIITPAGKIIS